jgi:hypothetical protein
MMYLNEVAAKDAERAEMRKAMARFMASGGLIERPKPIDVLDPGRYGMTMRQVQGKEKEQRAKRKVRRK